jgi:hypothetical protein
MDISEQPNLLKRYRLSDHKAAGSSSLPKSDPFESSSLVQQSQFTFWQLVRKSVPDGQ